MGNSSPTDYSPITGGNGNTPKESGQTSGRVIHDRPGRMNDAGNVENTKNLPS
jgi:hypothetical protein